MQTSRLSNENGWDLFMVSVETFSCRPGSWNTEENKEREKKGKDKSRQTFWVHTFCAAPWRCPTSPAAGGAGEKSLGERSSLEREEGRQEQPSLPME